VNREYGAEGHGVLTSVQSHSLVIGSASMCSATRLI
jgi:hypothetical protein